MYAPPNVSRGVARSAASGSGLGMLMVTREKEGERADELAGACMTNIPAL